MRVLNRVLGTIQALSEHLKMYMEFPLKSTTVILWSIGNIGNFIELLFHFFSIETYLNDDV